MYWVMWPNHLRCVVACCSGHSGRNPAASCCYVAVDCGCAAVAVATNLHHPASACWLGLLSLKI